MDAIDRAILQKKHISGFEHLNCQTWEQFNSISRNKKIVVFGAGVVTDLFWHRCENRNNVIAIVDNDKKIQGMSADQFSYFDATNALSQLRIQSPDVLKTMDNDEIVIVICSINYYEQIIRQLPCGSSVKVFVTLIMEANHRRQNNGDSKPFDGVNMYPICRNKIAFISRLGFSGHGKYIINELLKLRSDLDIVWMTDDVTQKAPEGVRVVHRKNLYELSTAQIWVSDYTCTMLQDKRDSQIYIQLKHWSSVTLKTFGLDLYLFRKEDSNENSINSCIAEGKRMDYLVAGSSFDVESCRRAFPFEGTPLMFGSPRSDVLFRPERYRQELCAKYNMDKDRIFVLYAPTFRCTYNDSVYYFPDFRLELDFDKIKKQLDERFGSDCYILLRLHPNVAQKSKEIEKPEYVIDVSDHPDSQELVAASDMMITDYSSIMFEPAFVRKPVFLFAPDLSDYVDKERELLIDYSTLPFSIAVTNDELGKNIAEFDNEKYTMDVDDFMKKYGVQEDGHASERTARFISDLIDGKAR